MDLVVTEEANELYYRVIAIVDFPENEENLRNDESEQKAVVQGEDAKQKTSDEQTTDPTQEKIILQD